MKVVRTAAELNEEVAKQRKDGQTVGFVPTMGALHVGHISLVNKCLNDGCYTICSIFVNPTQFNDKNDLKNYPRMPEKDLALLEECGVHLVFMPSVEEIYPEPDTRVFDFGSIDKVMEGAKRPGHFNGVAQIVSKLFAIVNPDKAYFGEKDFQQIAIINAMVKQLGFKVEIVRCPIVRDTDGLALSSRNMLLNEKQRKSAPNIYRALSDAKQLGTSFSIKEIKEKVIAQINADNELKVEYFDVVDADSLQSLSSWEESNNIFGCIAVQVGAVRLIDNIRLK
ncbi:pantoate--beta-alanine ligase [uncultured Acetobacteroides sp.]|uniref:pantoate--beta-alanine ligase n=1 Tax=uncultured Acetobacteroides sp. TaxID=1760811 RepID=UPI0029F55A5C|nr:pantoate--beta-alanine ligase [uncultured Acetobacteroides sp.]